MKTRISLLLTLLLLPLQAADGPEPFSFRGYPWGATEQHILDSEAGQPVERSDLGLIYRGSIAGLDAQLLYFIHLGRLYGGGYKFDTDRWDLAEHHSDYALIQTILIDKYGPAHRRLEPDDHTRSALWNLGETEIFHTLTRIGGRPHHFLRYIHKPTEAARQQALIDQSRDGF